MHVDFNKRHEVSHCSSPQFQHYSFPGIQTINVTKCPPNAALQVRINSCIYPKTKITLTFTLTLLLEIGSKGLDLKGHFMLDVKIGRASKLGSFLDISDKQKCEISCMQFILHMNEVISFYMYSQNKTFQSNEYISEIYFRSFLLNFRVYFQCHISILRMPTKKSPQGILFVSNLLMPSGSLISLVTSQHDHIVEALADKKLY